ncbi:hypothetical protein AGABI1DRAFT_135055 [Agaricus bisporus var. burnettii JB137-S8]|uniref:Uncharacterized protein n=1 Tax=Agaricus bisporus var. burnettii (strain JB137-S8 / ATCC MYA-4627 / FGSC 10392) TaxID=597362 RepID=K5WS09_AGABU|nr:uncharacterized protein AGABI1DRAFT_135055 [Agaricus bisporus var. burnettii JB137-S8]EKM73322.1 hypothetical protein AGABI1DRAFT_135055 [Agaricus bisporus var. burnettii JB137-S8]
MVGPRGDHRIRLSLGTLRLGKAFRMIIFATQVTPPTAGAPLEPPHVPRRTGRVRKPPDLAGNDSDSDDEAALLADSEYCEVEFAGAVLGADPRSYRLAMKSPDSDCWAEACILNVER